MKKMMKRILAFALAVCALLTLMPTLATAASGDVTYNLKLSSVYGANADLKVKKDAIAADYASNRWCLHSYNVAGNIQFASGDLRVYSDETEWIALKIKKPGTGVYTVKLNYDNSINSGTVAAYILPADTADVGAAISHENRVGKAVLTNLVNSDNVDATATFGTWNFGSANDYILVLEANRHSVYNENNCDMRLKQLIMTPGDDTQEAEQQKIPAPVIVDPGPIKIADPVDFYGTTTQVNGNDYMFMPIKGGTMLVFDLDNNVLVDEVQIPPSIARGITVDDDGVLWCVGESKYLFRYDPKTRIGENVLNVADVVAGGENGQYLHYADGCLYFGISPNGIICKYEIETGRYWTFGPFHEDCNTVSAIIPQGNYIYAGITGDADGENGFTSQVIKVNADSGNVEGYLDLSSGSETATIKLNANHRQFNGVALVGNLLLMGSNVDQSFVIAVDVRDMSFVDLGLVHGITFDITEEVQIGDKTNIYFYINGDIYSMDVTGVTADTVITDNIAAIDIKRAHSEFESWAESKPLRCGKHSIVEIDDPEMPGKNIVTYYTSEGPVPRLLNLQTGAVKKLTGLVESGYGSAMPARPLVNGLSGSNELYIGAFNTPTCAIYNTDTGVTTNFISNSAQTDAFVFYEGVLYTGNYNNASITKIVPDGDNVQLLSMKDSHNQARIHTLTAGGGKVFAGTTPYTGFGGCLAWVDVATGETYVQRNIVENQSINCLVYQDGLVFGTTYIDGGSGSGTLAGLSAKLFVFDVNEPDPNKNVKEFDLREYLSGFSADISYIAGIAADPNESGKFWGIISQTLFSFTYKDQELKVEEELSFAKDTYSTSGGRGSFPRPFCFDGAGNLYVAFDDAGGMRRINTADPADNERLPLPVLSYYALGEDGNLYYTWGDQLRMFPLNVTDNDWSAAETVDEMILAIGNPVTEAEEEAILAARAAYDDLSLKEKALVQYLYMLEEQEAELLELEIAALPEDISLDNKEQLDTLWETYSAMTDRQKNCIKNYAKLVAAVNAAYAYEGVAAYQAAGKAYYSFENAVAAALTADKTVTLVEDVTVSELLVTDGITLDLNGHILTLDGAFRAGMPGLSDGFVVDSSTGNKGLLRIGRAEGQFEVMANNPDMPLYDAGEDAGGYRFFDYKLERDDVTENAGEGREKFWFYFHFYTDDTCTEQDMDAYDLVSADGTNMQISVDISWKGSFLSTIVFGKPDENGDLQTHLFSEKWAQDATLSRWLYLVVSGLDKVGGGMLVVEPTVTVNGVVAEAGAISYMNEVFNTDTGWGDRIP